MTEGFDFVQGLEFSLFWKEGDNTKNLIPLKNIRFEDLISLIMSEKIKNLDKKERPYFTPYGTFSERRNKCLISYNKDLVCLDYDHVPENKMKLLDLYWRSRRSTILIMKSPSGDGLKVMLWAETGLTQETAQEEHYKFLKHNISIFNILEEEADPSQFVLSQPFFLPYNEDFYFTFHPVKEKYPFASLPPYVPPEPYIPSRQIEDSEKNRFFKRHVEFWINWINGIPADQGTHQKIYVVLMKLFPYLDQQTAVTELELTSALEGIVRARYGSDSEIPALHRSINEVKKKGHGLSLEQLMSEVRAPNFFTAPLCAPPVSQAQ